ncbi:ABC transporter substrate-binding protein [Actinophytocola algeriensis]|uniref:Branched-chain amino acid transport system substrate-binding protein n=1 Tax=Actinophytocola algeriensis TaxID=1768010 RepID=A0A7W7VHX0_9PSEU|nr:ABC transporter substrate-binding protein [Actinophytocola algeriensis]MBB4910485.1 branched-chain amino acid transport system substrate-binding protein [Actinophytocola algeriensis]MBE1480526.1 branched-chain amino acid transport system substrate-binding protein [Actinophytocola algeriensis]
MFQRVSASRRGRVIAVAAVTAVLAVSACSTSGADGGGADVTEIKIGAPLPLSGPNAPLGKDALQGAELAADILNDGLPGLKLPLANDKGVPNLDHAKFTIVPADTQGKPENGASAVNHLVNDEEVHVLAGALESGVTKTAAQQAERLQVPFVTSISSSPALTQQGLKWFFRTGPTDVTYAQSFFGLLDEQKKKDVPADRIALLYMNNTFGTDAAKVAKSLAESNNKQIVADVPFDPAATDLTSQLQNVRAAEPDTVFVVAYPPTATLFINATEQLDYVPPAVMAFGAGFIDAGFIESAGDGLEGMSRRVAWSEDLGNRNPAAKIVADEYQKRYDAPLTENSARVFTTMMALAQAVNNARSVDPDQIRAALTALDIPGRDTIMPWDGIKFDDQHQNTGARAVVEQRLDGVWKVVYPKDVAAQEIVWPASEARK